jgi:hypothetical protein
MLSMNILAFKVELLALLLMCDITVTLDSKPISVMKGNSSSLFPFLFLL